MGVRFSWWGRNRGYFQVKATNERDLVRIGPHMRHCAEERETPGRRVLIMGRGVREPAKVTQ